LFDVAFAKLKTKRAVEDIWPLIEELASREGSVGRWSPPDQVLQDFLIVGSDYTVVAREADSLRTVSAGIPSRRQGVL
jgi:hypothetical protein